MGWLWLAIAVAGDVVGTTALAQGARDRYGRFFVLAMAAYVEAFYAFSRALQTVPAGTADAVYFAASTAVIVTLGVVFFRERLTTRKITALLLVVAGVAVLRLEAGGV